VGRVGEFQAGEANGSVAHLDRGAFLVKPVGAGAALEVVGRQDGVELGQVTPLLLEVGPLGDLMEGTAAGVVAIAVVRYFVEGSDAGPPKMCWCSSAVISLIKRVRFVFSRSSALTSW